MIISVYQSEIATSKIHKKLIAIQHCAIAFGIALSASINVGKN